MIDPCKVCGGKCAPGQPVATGHWEALFKRDFKGIVEEANVGNWTVVIAKPDASCAHPGLIWGEQVLASYNRDDADILVREKRKALFANLLRYFDIFPNERRYERKYWNPHRLNRPDEAKDADP